MRNQTQLRQALEKIANIADFSRRHKLPERTIWRLRGGGTARRGTLVLVDAALDVEKAIEAAK